MKTNVQALRKLGSLSGHLSLRLPLFFTDCSIAKRSKPLSWVCPTFQSSDLCNPSGNATEERDLKGEFFSGLVVRILGFLCHVPGSIPARETEIPQAVRHGQKKKDLKNPHFPHGNPTTGRGSIPLPSQISGVCQAPRPGARPVALPSGSCTHTVDTTVPTAAGADRSGHRPLGAHPAPWGRLGAGPSTPAPPLGRPAP